MEDEKQERWSQEKQFIDVEFSGNKEDVKKQIAAYIDTLPPFIKTSGLGFKGLIFMPRVKESAKPTISIEKLVDSIHVILVPTSPDLEKLLSGKPEAIVREIEGSVLDALLKGLVHVEKLTAGLENYK